MTLEKLSNKQKLALKWCHMNSTKDKYFTLICDGAVRSGKTTVMTVSFIYWAMRNFNQINFGICGKTVQSAERNVIMPIFQLTDLTSYYNISYTRATKRLTVKCKKTKSVNYFYVFGGKDESSYMLIQGITLAGVLFDEVALMPKSFVEQAIARTLSIETAKLWFNCNPDNPNHWFYKEWICDLEVRKALYLHFLMTDNPIMTKPMLERAYSMYTGVFFDRYIKGLWVVAEGLIYKIFADNPENFLLKDNSKLKNLMKINIGVDFGGNKSAHTFVATGITENYKDIIALMSKKYDAKNITPQQLDNLFVDFVKEVKYIYGNANYVYCDSAEQTLILGLKKASHINNLGCSVRNALKSEINSRIHLTLALMSQQRFYYTENCSTLVEALKSAVWDDDKLVDVRLDNGTSDIDTLDAFEYTIERDSKRLINYYNGGE